MHLDFNLCILDSFVSLTVLKSPKVSKLGSFYCNRENVKNQLIQILGDRELVLLNIFNHPLISYSTIPFVNLTRLNKNQRNN